MKTYSVKEVAKMLNTSEETVRRWIRDNKIKAPMNSRKGGHIITESVLREFAKTSPKYAPAIAGSVSGILMASSAVLGSIIAASIVKNEENDSSQLHTEEIEKILVDKINASKELIKRKKTSLQQLEDEIRSEELELTNLQYLLAEMQKASINSDLGVKKDE